MSKDSYVKSRKEKPLPFTGNVFKAEVSVRAGNGRFREKSVNISYLHMKSHGFHRPLVIPCFYSRPTLVYWTSQYI